MLELKVRDGEGLIALQFEHSLLSLSKWESKHQKAFMGSSSKEDTEMIDYYQDMLLSKIDPNIVYRLSPEQLDDLSNYINNPMTASSVPTSGKGVPETVTSELIYYWMTKLKIDWSAERWHLNRLLMLIQIANYKEQPAKQTSQADRIKSWHEINEQNQKRFGTEG